MKTVLVTGGAGFIGSNFILHVLAEREDLAVVNFDSLTYAGNLENLHAVEEHPRYRFIRGDITSSGEVAAAFEGGVDAVVHFAAESHVDRSILGAGAFVSTNVLGTQVLLDGARASGVERFVHVSTDEVYGSLGAQGLFTETTPLAPNSPYSASKAGSDLLARAAFRTHGFPVLITRCSNNYGPLQFPEKLIPLVITNAMEGRKIPVYGDGKNIRDWLYVEDHCAAILRVLDAGCPGEIYNIGGNNEMCNLEIIQRILAELEQPESLIEFVKDRPGHDRRYAIDASKIRTELGWEPAFHFEQALARTIRWYREHRTWWERVRSGAYQSYYDQQYGERLT